MESNKGRRHAVRFDLESLEGRTLQSGLSQSGLATGALLPAVQVAHGGAFLGPGSGSYGTGIFTPGPDDHTHVVIIAI